MGVVRVPLLCLKDAFEIAVAEGHESRVRPQPMALDSPNQMISLLYNTIEEICAISWPFLKEVRV